MCELLLNCLLWKRTSMRKDGSLCDIPYACLLINHLPPACWSTSWKSTFKQQSCCRFDIMDSISYFVILTYAIVHVLIHHIIFRLYLYFLNDVFYISSSPVLTFSIDVIFILSILCEICVVWIQIIGLKKMTSLYSQFNRVQQRLSVGNLFRCDESV